MPLRDGIQRHLRASFVANQLTSILGYHAYSLLLYWLASGVVLPWVQLHALAGQCPLILHCIEIVLVLLVMRGVRMDLLVPVCLGQ